MGALVSDTRLAVALEALRAPPPGAPLIGRARANAAQRLPLQSRRIIGRGISKCWLGLTWVAKR